MSLDIKKSIVSLALIGGIALTAPTATAFAQDVATPDAYGGSVVKEVLGEDEPDTATGETLALTRYTIPAGAELPVHTHPGVQIATVESGELTYHVVEGELYVTRADGTQETVTAGGTVVFEEGDSWIEPEGMIHYAENLTDEDVVLMATSLLESDEDATILVDATPAS